MAGDTKDLRVNFIARDENVAKTFGTVSEHAGALHGRFGLLSEGLKHVTELAGGFAAVEMFKGAIESAGEYQKLLAQTNAVIKSTGDASGLTVEDFKSQAEALSSLSGVQDETIIHGENVIATFTNIKNSVGAGNDIFTQATASTLDLSTALGKDMQSSAILVGKALNDPIKGLSALSRVGVQFTSQQKEQIKAMVASGDQMGAQKLILAELNKEFGGSAKAAGDTFSGAMNKLKNTFNDTARDLLARLLPYLQKAAEWLGKALPVAVEITGKVFNTLRGWITPVVDAIKNIISGFSGATGASGKMSGAIGAVVNVFRTVGTVVATVIASVRNWIQNNQATLADWAARIKAVVAAAMDVFRGIVDVVQAVLAIVEALWNKFGPAIMRVVASTFGNLLRMIKAAMEVIRGIIDVVLGILTGHWSKAWKGVKEIFSGIWGMIVAEFRQIGNILGALWRGAVRGVIDGAKALWDFFKAVPGKILSLLASAGSWLIKTGVNLLRGLENGITSGALALWAWLKSLPGLIWDGIKDIGNWLLDAGRQLIQGLINGIKHMAGAAVDAVKGVGSDIMSGVKGFFGIHSPSTVFAELGGHLMTGMAQGITGGGGAVTAALHGVMRDVNGQAGSLSLGVRGNASSSTSAGASTPVIITLDGKTIGQALIPHIADPLRQNAQRTANRTGVYVS